MNFAIKKEVIVIALVFFLFTIPSVNSQCPSGGPVCGNGVCEGGEDCSSCSSDCGSCCVGNVGAQCNCGPCGCGGTITCSGSCSGPDPTPSNYGQSCGSCNRGTINCAGQCVGDYSNCGSAGWYNTGSSCGNCGTQQQYCNGCDWTGQYQCINQGPCSPGSTQCSGSRYQTCNSGCQWQNSGTDADGDGVDAQCGDSLCDNNPNFVNSNRQCDAGQTQCSNGRYQTCNNCAWQNSGTNADNDAKDLQCGDSLCDNSPSIYDSTKTPTENACADGLDNDCDLKTDCNDNDCDGSIAGTVKNQNNQPISAADVSAKKDLTTIKSTTTNQQGSYSITSLNCGTYNLVTSHPNYAPQTKSNVAVNPQQQTTSNFEGTSSLVLGTSCEQDCTFAADNLVHASCDGKNGCTFYDTTAKQACDNSQPGWVRDYNSSHYVTCASGAPQQKIEIKADVSCASGTLVKMTRIVVYNGKPVKLVVAVCG